MKYNSSRYCGLNGDSTRRAFQGKKSCEHTYLDFPRYGRQKVPDCLPEHENENRSEYALAGDVVNLAARLAAASEKEGKGVLCDETTLESLTGGVRLWLQTAGRGVDQR